MGSPLIEAFSTPRVGNFKDQLCFDPGEVSKIYARAKKTALSPAQLPISAQQKARRTASDQQALPRVKGASPASSAVRGHKLNKEEQIAVKKSLLNSIRLMTDAYSRLRYVGEKKENQTKRKEPKRAN